MLPPSRGRGGHGCGLQLGSNCGTAHGLLRANSSSGCQQVLRLSGSCARAAVATTSHTSRLRVAQEQNRPFVIAAPGIPRTLLLRPGGDAARQHGLDILLPERILLQLGSAVERRPLGLVLEEAHRPDVLSRTDQRCCSAAARSGGGGARAGAYGPLVGGEPVPDASGQDDEIALLERAADPPLVVCADAAAHVEVAAAVEHVADLLVLVQVLAEERAHLVLVRGAHRRRRHRDLVAVLVRARSRERVHAFDRREVAVYHPEPRELGRRQRLPRVVRRPLVGLECTVSDGSGRAGGWDGWSRTVVSS